MKRNLEPIGGRPQQDAKAETIAMLKQYDEVADEDLKDQYERLLDQLMNDPMDRSEGAKSISEWAQWIQSQAAKAAQRASSDIQDAAVIRAQAVQLREQLLEHDSITQDVIQHLVDRSEPMREECQKMVNIEATFLNELDASLRAHPLKRFTPQQLVIDAALTLPARQTQELTKYPAVNPNTTNNCCDELLGSHLPDARFQVVSGQLMPACTVDADPKLPNGILELYGILWSDLFDVKSLAEQLAAIDARIAELKRLIAQVEAVRQKAFDTEDYGQAEQEHWKSIDLQEELVNLLKKKMLLLAPRLGGSTNQFLSVSDRLIKDINDIRTIKTQLMGDIQGDREALAGWEKKLRQQNDAKLQQFNNLKEKNTRSLMDNEAAQREAWAIICRKFKELQEHAKSRQELVEEHIQDVQGEAKRLEEFDRKISAILPHRQLLDKVAQLTQAVLQMLPHVDDFARSAIDLIRMKEANYLREMADYTRETKKEYVLAFKQFNLTSGSLVFSKEKHLGEIERQIRGNKMRMELMKETLDPNFRQYKEDTARLETDRTTTSGKVKHLRDRVDDALEDFESVMPDEELALVTEGASHPSQELNQLNVDKKAKVLGIVAKFQEEEDRQQDDEADELEELSAVVQVTSKAPSKKAVRPLSPTRRSMKTPVVTSPTRPKSPPRESSHKKALAAYQSMRQGQ
eukprot:NODE_291_length_2480_cov_44.793455_g270_i0.p1 GENE.NODE_291_length_2480_cov_44.793455_g270_i0~~NODE_291_length_2480_cov_44.793455_g270_i0.p1  ORF type:complete len:773 (+),score=250.92 NODE_291_length_2480_cov_44.793455_g270_i0:257-2320(+)